MATYHDLIQWLSCFAESYELKSSASTHALIAQLQREEVLMDDICSALFRLDLRHENVSCGSATPLDIKEANALAYAIHRTVVSLLEPDNAVD